MNNNLYRSAGVEMALDTFEMALVAFRETIVDRDEKEQERLYIVYKTNLLRAIERKFNQSLPKKEHREKISSLINNLISHVQ